MPNVSYTGGGGQDYRASVDEGAGYSGGGAGDYGWMMELARRKAEQKLQMGDLELRAAKTGFLKSIAPKLGSAPPDPYMQAQEAARAQADATTTLSRGRSRDLMDTKNTMDAQTNDFYGTRMANTNPWFQNLPAAQAVQLGQQFPNGWDQYAQIAQAGRLPEKAYETINQAAARRDRQQGGGSSLG